MNQPSDPPSDPRSIPGASRPTPGASRPSPGDHWNPPPGRGPSLAWRLALSTSLVVTVVMGAVSVAQQYLTTERERQARERLLGQSLAPLVEDIERATNVASIRSRAARFHAVYIARGREHHHLVLRDGRGGELFSTRTGPATTEPSATLRATVSFVNAALPGRRGRVTVLERSPDLAAAVRRGWQAWAVHMVVTLGCILLFLQLAIRRGVTGPLERLLEGVRKMEMGYWDRVEMPEGAWEIRWLAWRFRALGFELQRTVRHLVDAEKRAARGPASRAAGPAPDSDRAADEPPAARERIDQRLLRARCVELENCVPGDPEAVVRARRAWREDSPRAELAGDIELRNRLRLAALRILDPEGLRRLSDKVEARSRALRGWLAEREAELAAALTREMVPYRDLTSRAKHVAGIYRKMRIKGLEFDEVHDMYALRVVVPTREDCYWALGVVHRTFRPILGRFKDYIVAPKANGYQSLHTSVRAELGPVFEVQIRSAAMHRQAERGSAADWRRKDEFHGPTPEVRGPAGRLLTALRARNRRAAAEGRVAGHLPS